MKIFFPSEIWKFIQKYMVTIYIKVFDYCYLRFEFNFEKLLYEGFLNLSASLSRYNYLFVEQKMFGDSSHWRECLVNFKQNGQFYNPTNRFNPIPLLELKGNILTIIDYNRLYEYYSCFLSGGTLSDYKFYFYQIDELITKIENFSNQVQKKIIEKFSSI